MRFWGPNWHLWGSQIRQEVLHDLVALHITHLTIQISCSPGLSFHDNNLSVNSTPSQTTYNISFHTSASSSQIFLFHPTDHHPLPFTHHLFYIFHFICNSLYIAHITYTFISPQIFLISLQNMYLSPFHYISFLSQTWIIFYFLFFFEQYFISHSTFVSNLDLIITYFSDRAYFIPYFHLSCFLTTSN
jgi:hypothetical protein